jgi:unsaturated chondroitin disaccharide hydrolase
MWKRSDGSPVFTVAGRYTSKGWTEWTQGFQFGMPLLQFDATGDASFLELGRARTLERMAPHLTHTGVHDHGFNNVSTYGNLWRLMNEGRIPENAWERNFYELALKASGAVQASRWTELPKGLGYIYSFNGPHSLFVDTIRSLRALALSHGWATSCRRRTIVAFPCCRGSRRMPAPPRDTPCSTAKGATPMTCGAARRTRPSSIRTTVRSGARTPSRVFRHSPHGPAAWPGRCADSPSSSSSCEAWATRSSNEEMLKAAVATCDFYIDEAAASDGIPYWDTGAPELHRLGNWKSRPADPFNEWEPVDSSAAAIAAQGLIRLGRYLDDQRAPGSKRTGEDYVRAGLTVLNTLLDEPYVSTSARHQGLLLHSVYHQPRGWDYIPKGRKVPCGESSMWGDYHLMEVALLAQRILRGESGHSFFHDPRSAP